MNTTISSSQNLVAKYLDTIIEANSEALAIIDGSEELTKAYKADQAKIQGAKPKDLATMRRELEELTGMLFNTTPLSTRDDQKFKWVDTANKSIPYRWLRRAGETETPRMIKNLRRLQLTDFSIPASTNKYGSETGFSLVWKDPDFKPKPDDKAELAQYERMLQAGFFYAGGNTTPNLHIFLGMMYEDFFDLDDMTIGIERDGLNRPIGLHIEDPSLWFPTIPKAKQPTRWDQWRVDDYWAAARVEIEIPEYAYLMMKGSEKLEARTRDVLYKSHFFQRSDFMKYRRGYSIMEQATRVTTIIMNAISFNASNFSNNRMPAGLLALSGGFTNTLQIEKIKKLMWAAMSGVANQHKFPIVGLPEKSEAKWVSIHNTNKEMEFYTGITLFTSIVCALSGTSPNELGLPSFEDAMKGKSLNEESKDGVWRQSQDNGLKTFLNHVEATLNRPMSDGRNVFEQATGLPVQAQFKGLAAEDKEKKVEINTKRLMLDTSVNEIRVENGEEEVEFLVTTPNGETVNIYDFAGIGNGNIAAFLRADQQAQQQMAQQEQMMKQQQEQAAGQAGNDGRTEEDQALIDQYGEPEE